MMVRLVTGRTCSENWGINKPWCYVDDVVTREPPLPFSIDRQRHFQESIPERVSDNLMNPVSIGLQVSFFEGTLVLVHEFRV